MSNLQSGEGTEEEEKGANSFELLPSIWSVLSSLTVPLRTRVCAEKKHLGWYQLVMVPCKSKVIRNENGQNVDCGIPLLCQTGWECSCPV